jgi:hypothetical protein
MVPQFRLPDQDNLNQFVFFGFEIGEEANLFKDFTREILCFIDNQDRRSPCLVFS